MGDFFSTHISYYCDIMKITPSQNINNNTMLMYASSMHKSNTMPVYVISADKADEFVKKYNKQASILGKITAAATISSFGTGFILSPKKSNILAKCWNACICALFGFLTSSYIAYNLNNKLMDKYNVRTN